MERLLRLDRRIPRLLLAAAAGICVFGGAAHTAAFFATTSTSISRSGLSPILAAELKVLWLADSTTLLALALLFGFIAAKPNVASRAVIVLLAVMPAATAVLLYLFLGPFYAGHLLTAATVMVCLAGVLMRTDSGPVRTSLQHQGRGA
jgi:hypothetical protein